MRRTRPRPVVIDTDPGVDDALAILLALRSPELDVVGITTVCGNVPVDQATRNLLRVLRLVRSSSRILLGQGAASPLERALETATHVHGPDGLGDLDRFKNRDGTLRYPQADRLRSLPGPLEVWRECMERYPGELSLITLGPLTNLAQVLESDPALVKRFHSISCMAGAIAVPGNVRRVAEFNVYVDPDAAEQVLQAGLPLTMVPLDVTTQVTMNRRTIHTLTRRSTHPVSRFFGDATGYALDFAERVEGRPVFPFHDPLVVAIMVDPTLVRVQALHVNVETEGRYTLGATVADRRMIVDREKPPPNVSVAMQVDVNRALRLFRERLCPASS